MKLLSKTISIVFFFLGLQLASVSPVFAQTSPWSGVCVSPTDETVATIQGLQCLLANVLSIFLTLVGVTAFIMLMVSAFIILNLIADFTGVRTILEFKIPSSESTGI